MVIYVLDIHLLNLKKRAHLYVHLVIQHFFHSLMRPEYLLEMMRLVLLQVKILQTDVLTVYLDTILFQPKLADRQIPLLVINALKISLMEPTTQHLEEKPEHP